MQRKGKAAICRELNKPVVVETIQVDGPKRAEVTVRVAACGVCHSDLSATNGTIPLPPPLVLGHEAAGEIVEVGEGVSGFAAGDHVVTSFIYMCGKCRFCAGGRPVLCVEQGKALTTPPEGTPRTSDAAGKPLNIFSGCGVMAEYATLSVDNVVKIDPQIPLDRAALVGCGVLTGVGAALRTSGLQGGQTVAVFGCGGVGLSIVQGARIGGASQIIGVDVFDSKLEMAKRVGATHVVNIRNDDPVKAIRALTGGAGVDHAFEAVGNATLVRQAIESLAIRGTATIVGVLPPDATIEFPWMAIRPECKVQTSRMGSNRFRIDIPRYLEFYRQGRLLLDEMVTRRGPLDDINEAFRAMKAGEVARTVLTFD